MNDDKDNGKIKVKHRNRKWPRNEIKKSPNVHAV